MPCKKQRLLFALPLIFSFVTLCQSQDKTAEQRLAARIVEAKTEGERASILESGKEAAPSQLFDALVTEGDKVRNLGKFADAIGIYSIAQNLAEKMGDNARLSLSLDRIGNTDFRRDNYEEALKSLRRSLELREQLGDKGRIAETLYNTGQVYEWQEKYDLALEFYSKALALSEEVKERAVEGSTLRNIGNVYRARGRYDLAAVNYLKSLRIKEELGDKDGVATALNGLGGLSYFLRDYSQAVDYFTRSLALYEELGNRPRANAVRGNLSTTFVELGQIGLALELAQKYLAEAGESRQLAARANTLLGNLYFYQSNTALALEYYQKSLVLKEQISASDDIGIALHNIAGVHARQGNYELALEYYRRALEKRSATKEGVAETLNRMGDVYSLMGDPARSLEYLQKSMAIAEEMKDRLRVASLLNSIGDISREQGEWQKALSFYQRSDALFEEIKVKRNRALVNKNIADLYYRMGDYPRAIDYAGRALRITEELNQPAERPAAYTTIGRALKASGKPVEAESAFNEAIKSVEEMRRTAAGGERDAQRFFEGQVSPYYAMVELLVGENRLYEALSYAERAKGRVLLDVLQSGKMDVTKSMSAAEQAEERRLSNELVSLNAQITRERQQASPDTARLAELEKRRQKARLDHEAFETALYAAHPELKLSRGRARIIEPTQTLELLPDARTALMQYVVADERTYLFVLTRSSRAQQTVADLKVYPIEIKRASLAARVGAYRRAMAERDPGFRAPSGELYDLLVGPARAQLQGHSDLVIIPDGELWELPFQSLMPGPDRFLIEESAVAYGPSLSVLLEMQNLRRREFPEARGETFKLLAFGNPMLDKLTMERARAVRRGGEPLAPLPETEEEVRGLAQIYGTSRSRVYTRAEAREERAKAEASRFSIIHFATHGVLNDTSPMYSHIVLSLGQPGEDGLLEAWEIAKLNLRADMVVLSACETARGRFGAGEGIVGLTWALFVAGSPSTVVSQWKVDSAVTKQLMLSFHSKLKAKVNNNLFQNRKSESLREAQISLMRTREFRHPFYWASFMVIGDRR
jgi:CHAT domain-containing protein/lipopolysaccharide biosynthesis regulator YciM